MRDEHRIAIIGIGLRYPDATSPGELWENVLSGRRPFRAASCWHDTNSGGRAADRRHRLAQDVVSAALADAGYRDGVGLPRATTSVVLGGGPGTTGSGQTALAAGIADDFELGGGGFVVGGGGSPALLPVIAAAAALADHDVDVAVAGRVALCAQDADRFDGSGLLVLMREADAIANSRRIYASITGYGISSVDSGVDGRHLALARAYRRAGYPIDTVSYFEGNDPAIAPARSSAGVTDAVPVGRDTGFAGLIKAVLAVHNQVIPPAATPHELVPATAAGLYFPTEPALWPTDRRIRVGVSARGSGGINTHVTIEELDGRQQPSALAKRTIALTAGRQDAEVLLLDAPDRTALWARVTELADRSARLAGAELTDLSGALAAELTGGPVRAAVVATDPADAHRKLTLLRDALASDANQVFPVADGVFLADRATPPRIAFLFPGRESGGGAIGAIRRRFTMADTIMRIAGDAVREGPTTWTQRGTPDAVPSTCVVAASLAATRVLRALGVDADIATGAGLGELTTLAWGGALGGTDLLRLAASVSPTADLAAIPLMPLHRDVVQIGGDLRNPPPVEVEHAVATALRGAGLAIEVGPGRVRTGVAERVAPEVPVLSVETDSDSLVPLLRVIGAAHSLGVVIDTTVLFAGRVIRPLPVEQADDAELWADSEVPGVAPLAATYAMPAVRTLPTAA